MRKIATIETIEEFWGVINSIVPCSKLPNSCNYHLFREGLENCWFCHSEFICCFLGVAPKWEDAQNAAGGKWVGVLATQRKKLDKMWIASCVAAISEQLESEKYPDQVCGVVVSLRKNQDKLSLWTGGSNEKAVLAIGNLWKKVVPLKIAFQVHSEAMAGGGSNSSTRTSKFIL